MDKPGDISMCTLRTSP